MNHIDRYIGKAVIMGVIAVMLVMFSLITIIGYAGEASKIGHAEYDATTAIIFVLLRSPQQLYEMFPLVALLGTILGLGTLATNSELIAMRAAGISVVRIAGAVAKSGVVIVVGMVLLGELIAPPAIQQAKSMRVNAMESKITLNTDYGLWARDGDTFIHIRSVEDEATLIGIKIFLYNEEQEPTNTISASSADYVDDHWILNNVTKKIIGDDFIKEEYIESMPWHSSLTPELVDVVSVIPENLSIYKLKKYIRYLENSQLETRHHYLVFWSKIFAPVTLLAMILLAIPFVFGSLRDAGLGQRVVIGFLLGLGFYMFNKLIGEFGLVYDFMIPSVAAAVPSFVVVSLGYFLIKRVR